jgi:hypothetical protein
VLTSFYRITRPDLPLTVYIEGDGMAWRSRTTPAENPTPHQALGLALAVADPAANVVYLARPYQFTPLAVNPRGDKAYWTNKRFSVEVVASMDRAVTQTSMLHVRIMDHPRPAIPHERVMDEAQTLIDKKRRCEDNPHCAGERHERQKTIRAV